MQLSAEEAAARLEDIVDRAIAGEHIVISLDDGTAVRLEPIGPDVREKGNQS